MDFGSGVASFDGSIKIKELLGYVVQVFVDSGSVIDGKSAGKD